MLARPQARIGAPGRKPIRLSRVMTATRHPTATRPPAVAPAYPAPRPSADQRNPGTPLDLDAVLALRVNRSAVERRAATIPTRRTVKKEWQAAWLLRTITCLDLTTLQ